MEQKKFVFVLSIFLLAIRLSEEAIRFPPLFRENPNERSNKDLGPDEVLDYRLPNNTEPLSYEIELTTNVHTGDTAFTGRVNIEVRILESTTSIVLHARQLIINSVQAKNLNNSATWELNFTHDPILEFLHLSEVNGNQFEEGTHWLLTINYNGVLRRDNGGFYISTYEDANGKTRYLATTQFESTDARHAFPCYDEPSKRSYFTITINHDPSYHAISNMPVKMEPSNGKTVFQQTLKMSPYLLAFIVSDFNYTEGILYNLPQRVYSRPGTEHDQEWALVSGLLISKRLAEYYDVDFPLPKLDQAAIPDFAAGAMENWGLATYREEYLLYNTVESTVNTQTNIANIIAHEYCHMWFGDLVSIKWWTYLWLKEGFATLFSYQATDDAYPEWGIWQMFHAGEYQSALTNDASDYSRPMTHYVQTPREISNLYDTVSYAKAGSVLGMFQHALPDGVFRRGLHNYLSGNQFDSAEENDLFEAIQTAAKELNIPLPATIETMMSSWSRKGGYPVLHVTRDYANGSFNVTQRAFFNNENKTDDHMWYVPFNYIDATNWDFRNTTATHYIKNTERELQISANIKRDDWLILNKQSTGYYRINYDEQNWYMIIDALLDTPQRIHPRNRAQLMHDAYRFMSSHRLSHSILLSMLTYLKNEDQYAPWSTANGIITIFNRLLASEPDYELLQEFIYEIASPMYEKLGINDIPGEQHFQKYTRNIIINIACLTGNKDCLEETNNKLKAKINNNIEIEPNLRGPIYCNGLKQSGQAEFNYVYEELMSSSDQAFRRLLISSLGCSQRKEDIEKFISSSIDMDNELRTQERTTLLSSAYSRGEVGLLACIDFLDKNWEEYGKLSVDSKPLDRDLRSMSQYVVNEEQKEKLTNLVQKVENSVYVNTGLASSVNNNIQSNFDWLTKNRAPLFGWLRSYRNSSPRLSSTVFPVITGLLITLIKYF